MILNWEKPKKIRSTETHNNMNGSDSGVDGTYVPNMSKEDMYSWKAKHVKGADERIEIRKTILGTQLLIIVKNEGGFEKNERGFANTKRYKNTTVKMSMNGPLYMSDEDNYNLQSAIQEAKDILNL